MRFISNGVFSSCEGALVVESILGFNQSFGRMIYCLIADPGCTIMCDQIRFGEMRNPIEVSRRGRRLWVLLNFIVFPFHLKRCKFYDRLFSKEGIMRPSLFFSPYVAYCFISLLVVSFYGVTSTFRGSNERN